MSTPSSILAIPTYAADGSRLRDHSLKKVLELEREARVICERNQRGRVLRATFRHADGGAAVATKPKGGTKYSVNQALPSGHRAWKFTHVLSPADAKTITGAELERQEAERFIRGVHLAVIKSCMAESTATKATPTKVVSIASARTRPAHRPIEFDSEGRAAA